MVQFNDLQVQILKNIYRNLDDDSKDNFRYTNEKLYKSFESRKLANIEKLNRNGKNLKKLPIELVYMKNVYNLNLDKNELKCIPDEIGNYRKLRFLSIRYNNIEKISPAIGRLKNLTRLSLRENGISHLPEEIGELSSLTHIFLQYNEIQTIPESIGKLELLHILNFDNNKVETIPKSINKCEYLHTISLENNKISNLPKELFELKNLCILNLNSNKITAIPKEIENASSLQLLSLNNNSIENIISELFNLKELKSLYIKCNKIKEIPSAIQNANTLETLYLSSNSIQRIPEELMASTSLTEVNLSENKIDNIPNSINSLKNLTLLDLSYNKITEIPIELSDLSNLETLNLNHNLITEIPFEVKKGKLKKLKHFNIKYNNINNTNDPCKYTGTESETKTESEVPTINNTSSNNDEPLQKSNFDKLGDAKQESLDPPTTNTNTTTSNKDEPLQKLNSNKLDDVKQESLDPPTTNTTTTTSNKDEPLQKSNSNKLDDAKQDSLDPSTTNTNDTTSNNNNDEPLQNPNSNGISRTRRDSLGQEFFAQVVKNKVNKRTPTIEEEEEDKKLRSCRERIVTITRNYTCLDENIKKNNEPYLKELMLDSNILSSKNKETFDEYIKTFKSKLQLKIDDIVDCNIKIKAELKKGNPNIESYEAKKEEIKEEINQLKNIVKNEIEKIKENNKQEEKKSKYDNDLINNYFDPNMKFSFNPDELADLIFGNYGTKTEFSMPRTFILLPKPKGGGLKRVFSIKKANDKTKEPNFWADIDNWMESPIFQFHYLCEYDGEEHIMESSYQYNIRNADKLLSTTAPVLLFSVDCMLDRINENPDYCENLFEKCLSGTPASTYFEYLSDTLVNKISTAKAEPVTYKQICQIIDSSRYELKKIINEADSSHKFGGLNKVLISKGYTRYMCKEHEYRYNKEGFTAPPRGSKRFNNGRKSSESKNSTRKNSTRKNSTRKGSIFSFRKLSLKPSKSPKSIKSDDPSKLPEEPTT